LFDRDFETSSHSFLHTERWSSEFGKGFYAGLGLISLSHETFPISILLECVFAATTHKKAHMGF